MMQVTFNVTGRDIVNALKAGKSVIVHAIEPDGYEEYVTPYRVTFNESTGHFHMELNLDDNTITIDALLDSTIEYSSGSSSGGIK